MTGPEDNLTVPAYSAAITPVAEMLDLPELLIARTVLVAEPALEAARIGFGRHRGFISAPPYGEIKPGTVERDSRSSLLSYHETRADGLSHGPFSFTPAMLFSPDEAGLKVKVERQLVIAVARDELVADSPLGRGALIIANEFGGIDYENPEATARHLVARSAIATQARLERVKDMVHAGLLHQLLGELYGQDLAGLLAKIKTLVDAAALIPEEARAQAGRPLLSGAIAQAQEFVDDHAEVTMIASASMKNPEVAGLVVEKMKELNRRGLSGISSSSQLESKLPYYSDNVPKR